MKTLVLLLLILTIVIYLTKWLAEKKNEQIIKSFLNIEDENVEDFECKYGKNN